MTRPTVSSWALLLAVTVSILGSRMLTAEEAISGPPTIIDGDSLEVAGQRFDLHGIDAPEPGVICEKTNGKRFDCGRIATTALLDLTAGLDVTCRPVESPDSADLSAECTAGGFSLSRNMIHTGWARRAAAGFIEVEQEAKAEARGLWQYKLPPPPWPEPGR